MGLSNSQYNAIMREYDRLQAEDRADLIRRREKVFLRVPELKELDKKPGILAMERFREAVRLRRETGQDGISPDQTGTGTPSGTGSSAETGSSAGTGFSEELSKLEARKQELLKAAGFAPDELDMRYHCPLCRDTGMKDGQRCSCFNAKAVRILYAQSNIEHIKEKENFDSFSLDWYDNEREITALGVTERKWMEHVLSVCRNFVDTFKEKKGNLLFQGNTGVGKTFLSNCIAGALLDKGFSVIYLTAGELFDLIAAVRIDKTEDMAKQELYDWLYRADLLILDDLGTETANSFTVSQLFQLVNARLTAEQGTVISTNLSMRMLRDTYTERVTSRIASGYRTVMLYGDDIRKKKRMKEYRDGQ